MNKVTFELLTLRKTTRIDELIRSVPKPRNAVPKNALGLPLWSHIPLDYKLPVLHGPKREQVFTRDKIGRKLWQNPTQNDFNLSDPNCLDVSYHYESLHDENLRLYFKNKVNRKRMLDAGLITRQGDAVCSLKDYNNYRRYLKRVHQDAVNAERVTMEQNGMERFLLRQARNNEERDLMVHARTRIRKAKMQQVTDMLAAERQAKMDHLDEFQKRLAERLRKIAANNEKNTMRRMEKAKAFDAKIKQRMQQGQDIERKRKIKFLKKWHDSETARRKRMTRERWRKIMEKERNDYHQLQQKIKCQENRLERQKQLLDNYQMEMAIRAEIRSKDVEYKRLKMEDKLMKIKAERVRDLSEHAWSVRLMVKALCKAWKSSMEHKTPEQIKEEKYLIEKTIQLQIAEYKNKAEGKEVLAILQGAKKKLDKLFGVPEPVSDVVDSLLNQSIVEYVRRQVDEIISDAPNQAELLKHQHEEALRAHNTQRLLAMKAKQMDASTKTVDKAMRRLSTLGNVEVMEDTTPTTTTRDVRSGSFVPGKTRSQTKTAMGSAMSVCKPQRLVSFGTIKTIDKLTNEELAAAMAAAAAAETTTTTTTTTTTNADGKTKEKMFVTLNPEDMLLVKRTKERPPTPVPSLTELVDAAFQDTTETHESAHDEVAEKENLDLLIAGFSKKLLKMVLTKADRKAGGHRKLLFRQLSNVTIDRVAVVKRITDAILYDGTGPLMELPEMDHITDVLAKDVLVKRAGSLTDAPEHKPDHSKLIKKLMLI